MTEAPLELQFETMGRTGAAIYPDDGPLFVGETSALDVIGATYGSGAELVVLPVSRLDPAFFDLKNGSAGAALQKFQNYGLRVAIIGDIAGHVARSKALADFTRETTRRGEVLFLPDRAALAQRLA